MLTQISEKLDRFYLIFGALLVVLALIVITTLRASFAALNVANDVDTKALEGSSIHIIDSKIEHANKVIEDKKFTTLDLR